MTDRKETSPLLSSNDLAGAAQAVQLALAWYRDQPKSGWRRKEEAKFKALLAKLDVASDHKNPYSDSDEMPLDWGDDPIYGPLP
jgi:hypothetical protein